MAAFEMLKTDYVDAVFEGLRKYLQIANPDGTLSFTDVTQYTVKEGSFLGAKDINMMNTAMNLIMAALNDGTNLYDVFIEFFENQKELFQESSNEYNIEFLQFIEELKNSMEIQWDLLAKDYVDNIERFEAIQKAAFQAWFDAIRNTLSSVENGELLLKLEKMIEDMNRIATDADIEAIISGTYVDDDTVSDDDSSNLVTTEND